MPKITSFHFGSFSYPASRRSATEPFQRSKASSEVTTMTHSRREFLTTAASAATFVAIPSAHSETINSDEALTPDRILKLFEPLPGDKSLKILVPSVNGKPTFQAKLNSDRMLFVASAIKTFVLCERLRQ